MPMDHKEEVITHRLTPKSGCFREIDDLLIVLQSMAMASEYLVSGAVQFAPGDYVTVEAQHCRQKIRLPLFGPVQAALAGRKADVIELSVVSGTAQERTYAHWTNGFMSVMSRVFLPYMVAYHEAHKDEIEKLFLAGRTSKSPAWQMLWAVRNAASHGGRVFKGEGKAAVQWRGLSHGPADDKNRPLLTRMNGGDFLLLLLECEQERAGYEQAR